MLTPGSFLQYLACIILPATIAGTFSYTVWLTSAFGLHDTPGDKPLPDCAVHCMLACVLGIPTRCHFLSYHTVTFGLQCASIPDVLCLYACSGAEMHAPMVDVSCLACCSARAAAQQHR